MLNKNNIDFNENISPIAFAQKMFVNTSANGTLYLNNWYDVDCADCLTYNNFVTNIKWSENDLEDIISEFNQLVDDIKIIANHLDEFDGIPETAVQILVDGSIVCTYFIYVAPIKATSQEELEVEVISRLSEGLCGYEIIRHSQRLCRLFSLNAPQTVIENEERMLIASLTIHSFGERIEKVD